VKKLFKNATIVDVFTGALDKGCLLVDEDRIIGVGAYEDDCADEVVDLSGKYVCPGFIDGHMHIESTMMTPARLAEVSLPHGTTAVVADPHEIANVCGVDGLDYMLEASEDIPLKVFFMLPSCVPATAFDEAGGRLAAKDLRDFYHEERVVGLAEMMNYPGVIYRDEDVLEKIADAKKHNMVVDGHAPLLSGKKLDKYVGAGIGSDHECSNFEEALEKIKKGQMIMIREGTAARNLQALLPLFDARYSHRCMLATDDRHPADLLADGHIDNIVRKVGEYGKSVITAIQMATIQAAQYFSLPDIGAIAPGFKADFLVLDDLNSVSISEVYVDGELVAKDGEALPFDAPSVTRYIENIVKNSFHVSPLSAKDFYVQPNKKKCRVIAVRPGQLITDEWQTTLDFSKGNGVDLSRDILKLAVIERHKQTGHIGLGYVGGIGLKKGAIASSVSHDSHNIIVIGCTEEDMALAANRIIEMGGGNVVVANGKVLAEMRLPVAGLMSEESARQIALQNKLVRFAVDDLGVAEGMEPFMNMAFVSLPVIPHLKITPGGLVDVDKFERVSLFVEE